MSSLDTDQTRKNFRLDQAAAFFERAQDLEPSYAPIWVSLAGTRSWEAELGYRPRTVGIALAWQSAKRALELGGTLVDAAFEWLRRAYETRDASLAWTLGNPYLRSPHDDPRWGAFLKKMKLDG
ncbi:MAG: hypothetical protein V3S30_11685 [Thermoanaerobaculia bacterium]